jgi:CheY-like chemotaxis protein
MILVVEDKLGDQYVLKQLLARYDYEAMFVSSAEEALDILKSMPAAALLLDISLPGMNGLACAREIRRRELHTNRHLPIIAVTARAAKEDRVAAMHAGFDDYLSKPFEPEELRRILLRWTYSADKPNLKLLRRES